MPKPGVYFVVPLLEKKFPSSGSGQDDWLCLETNRRYQQLDVCRIRCDLDGNADDEPYHKSVTTMSQRAETVVNFNQKPPRKRKAQEPGAQEEQPASKRRKQVCVSPKNNPGRPLIVSGPLRTTQHRQIGQVVVYLLSLRVISSTIPCRQLV